MIKKDKNQLTWFIKFYFLCQFQLCVFESFVIIFLRKIIRYKITKVQFKSTDPLIIQLDCFNYYNCFICLSVFCIALTFLFILVVYFSYTRTYVQRNLIYN